MASHLAEPHLFVVLGGHGDLMFRKLVPALYRLVSQGEVPAAFRILGAARSSTVTDQSLRAEALEGLRAAGFSEDERVAGWCEQTLFYQSIGGEGGYRKLAERIAALESEVHLGGNRIFYLALPPAAFPTAIESLGEVGLNRSGGWTRLVVEKPFGRDLASAEELNRLVHRHFSEEQVYRIDHYLGKETVQNLLVFRFANPLFEHMWNRDRVERIEITVAESLGVEGRAGYYDQAGALRDMIQNHLTQLLTLTTMEIPGLFDAESIRNEKVKVLQSIRLIQPEHAVFARYGPGEIGGKGVPGYLEEPGVAPDSVTETYAAVRVEIENWRWTGIPIVLRSAKRMPRRVSQLVVTFRHPPVACFRPWCSSTIDPDQLIITIQPDEGFDLTFQVKALRSAFGLQTQRLRFRYAEAHGPLPEAYETLLQDVMHGDPTLFVRADEVEAAWALYTPLLEQRPPIRTYPAGTWGPSEADRLLGGEGITWTVL